MDEGPSFTTDALFNVVVPITLTSTHKFRAQYPGSSTQYPGTSRKAKVTVVPRVKVHRRTQQHLGKTSC